MKYPLILLLFLCTLSCSSSGQEQRRAWFQENGKLKVLSTIGMIGDLVAAVGGEKVDSLVLVQGELDPHTYQLVKGDDEKLQFADIIFSNGLGLEHGPSLRYKLDKSAKHVALGDYLQQKMPEKLIYHEGELDPHIWMDISLWNEAVPLIVQALSEKDPHNRELFAINAKKLQEKLSKVHLQSREILQKIPSDKRYLITSHDAFNYFSRAYLATEAEKQSEDWRERFQAPEGLSPESQLSASDIREILEHLQKYKIPVLFLESNVSPASIEKIVSAGRELGLNLRIAMPTLYGDALGEEGSGAESYPEMILRNAETISSSIQEAYK